MYVIGLYHMAGILIICPSHKAVCLFSMYYCTYCTMYEMKQPNWDSRVSCTKAKECATSTSVHFEAI